MVDPDKIAVGVPNTFRRSQVRTAFLEEWMLFRLFSLTEMPELPYLRGRVPSPPEPTSGWLQRDSR